MKVKLFFGLILVVTVLAEKVSYHGFQVLRVSVENHSQLELVQKLYHTGNYRFWLNPRIGATDIMVAPEMVSNLKAILEGSGLEFAVLIENIEDLIQDQEAYSAEHKSTKAALKLPYDMDWNDYHVLGTIYDYLDYLKNHFADATTEVIGQSYEGRDIVLMKICRGRCGNKPAIWIDGGMHGCEWISPATVTFLLKQLTEDLNPENEFLVEDLDWYILPVANPDSYEFSWSTDRLWSKTRSEYAGNFCTGTDMNRNFEYYWNDGGMSSCSEAYHGPTYFSEVEAVSIRDFVLAHKDQIKFFNTVQSYGQMILMPFGYTYDEKPDNYADLLELGNKAADTIAQVHDRHFDVDLIPNLIGASPGNSVDWTLAVAGIKYSYVTKLRDTGSFGLLLPPEEIIPSGEEMWAMWKEVATQVKVEFGK